VGRTEGEKLGSYEGETGRRKAECGRRKWGKLKWEGGMRKAEAGKQSSECEYFLIAIEKTANKKKNYLCALCDSAVKFEFFTLF